MNRDDFYQDAVRVFNDSIYHYSDFAEIPDNALHLFQPSTWVYDGAASAQAKAPNKSCTLTLFVETEEFARRNSLPHYSAVLADSIGMPVLYGETNSFRDIKDSLLRSAEIIRTMDGFPDETAIRNLLSCGLQNITTESDLTNTDRLFRDSIRQPLRDAVEGTLLMSGQEKNDKYAIRAVIQKNDDTFTSARFRLDGTGSACDWQETPQEDLDSAILPLVCKGSTIFYKDHDAIRHLGRHAQYPLKPCIPSMQDAILLPLADLCGYTSTKDTWENRLTEVALAEYIRTHPDASREKETVLEEFRKCIGKGRTISHNTRAGR